MAVDHWEEGQRVLAKIRYNHAGASAVVSHVGTDCLELIFDEPVRAVTPGQAVVLYDGEDVLGGGTIVS
jgi:tRNA-specific 2-thiouridylase